jgi:hypothetical protein
MIFKILGDVTGEATENTERGRGNPKRSKSDD